MHFVFTANSPGEVATWLTPTVGELRRRKPTARVTVFLVPCAFASGAETDVVRALPEVDDVYGPGDYWRIALGGPLPEALVPLRDGGERGALLYLGGDLIHALRLARRLRIPGLAYVERGTGWMNSFAQLLVPDEEARARVLRKKADENRVHVVGNLMVDAVRPTKDRETLHRHIGLTSSKPTVAVFPGSRSFEIQYSLPFLLRSLERVAEQTPGVQTVISLSPFASAAALEGRHAPGLDGAALRVKESPFGWKVTTDSGLVAHALQRSAYDIMQAADVAVTLPGSNTAEMAAVGLPMVVVLPLNLAEKIPLPGLAHYVEKLPGVGKRLKRLAVRRSAERMRFVAWPNRKAGTRLVPEVRGHLEPDDVARVVLKLLHDPGGRAQLAERLTETMGPEGAAGKVVERLLAAGSHSDSEGGGGPA